MKIIREFKEFISRGNVIDMAVGIVIGTAFTNIISSLVKNILTPLLSLLTGKINISSLAFKVNDKLSITYGAFLQAIIDFLVIAIAVFTIVKLINTFRTKMEVLAHAKAKEEEAPVEEKLTKEQVLLTEIRDLLQSAKD